MRFSIFALATLWAYVAYSQSISTEVSLIPACSLACLSNAIVGVGCSLTDYGCQCGAERASIAQMATPCIVSSCNVTLALTVQKVVQEICALQYAASSSSVALAATGGGKSTTAPVSSIGSSIGSSIFPAPTTTYSPTTTTGTASSSSTPAQGSQGAGTRLEVAGAVVGAAIVVALAL